MKCTAFQRWNPFRLAALVAPLIAAWPMPQAQAANNTWAVAGGTGNWDTTTANWTLPANWNSGDTAVFGGTSGTVTLMEPITAGGLTFDSNGYIIAANTAADVLTLNGATPTVTVTNAADMATISAAIAGTAGLTTAGAGTLVLSGTASTFSGGVTIGGASTLSVGADTNLGAAANGITINGATLHFNTGFSTARVVTLGTGGGTLSVAPSQTATLTAALAATANNLTKAGNGTLQLDAASTRTGLTAVNGGTLRVTNVGALGNGDITVGTGATLQNAHNAPGQNFPANVVLNGGSFVHNPGVNQQLNFAGGKAISLSGAGGTVDVSPGAGSTSKLFLTAGQLASAAGTTLTKTGPGVLQLNGANSGYLGTAVTISAGTVEFQNVDALGTATATIDITGATGDFVASNVAVRHNFNLSNGGILSANGGANGNFTGTINVGAGGGTAALRQFQTVTTANSFRIDGALTGAGTLNVTAPAAATLTLGTTPLTAGTPTNNTGFTGKLNIGTNATVVLNQALASTAGIQFSGGAGAGALQLRAANLAGATVGSAGINASYYNMGSDVAASGNPSQFASFQLIEPTRVFNRIDPQINVPNLGGGGTYPVTPVPGYQFNVNDAGMWKGLLNVTTAGNYQFSAINDDQAVLLIDGVQVGTIGVNGAGANVGGAVNLSAGAHSIVWKFSQGGGGGYTQLRYNGADTGGSTVVVGSVAGSLTNGSLAATPIGPIDVLSGTGNFDTGVDVSASALNAVGGTTLNLTSSTMSNIAVTGASTLSGAGVVTINPNTASLTFQNAINGPGIGLTLNGLYETTFTGSNPNTYNGTTTVSGGRLNLDITGGNAITGDLTINAANALGMVRNVVLKQSDQIADTATVNVSNFSVLDMGANSDTIGTLTMSGGLIMGGGTLTPTAALNLTGGRIDARLGGSLGLAKAGAGTVTLGGNNTYAGLTAVNVGVLKIAHSNALGTAGLAGSGNDTTVAAGAQLQVEGGITTAVEEISVTGTGLAGTGAVRNTGGNNTLTGPVTMSGATTVQSDSGNLNIPTLNTGGNALTVQGSGETTLTNVLGAGGITKNGNGTLSFTTNMASLGGVTHNAGILGFHGTQSFGPAAIPANTAYKFYADPTAGVNLAAGANTAVIAGYAADQALLSRINSASAGTYALGVNSTNNLDFSGHANLALGGYGVVTYGGTITPAAGGYRFGGAPASGTTPNILKLATPLTGSNAVTVVGGTTDIAGLANTFTGSVNLNGGVLRILNNTDLGAAANVVNLNGGTLEYAFTSHNTGHPLWAELGNALATGQRTINVGASGGTISVGSFNSGGNLLALSGTNPLTGSGALTKTGFGHVMLMSPTNYSGALTVGYQSANFEMRGQGALTNVSSVTVNQSSNFVVDNQNGWGPRQFASVHNGDRVPNAAPITLSGGALYYRSRSVAGQNVETFGATTIGEGNGLIRLEKNGTVGGEMIISNLIRNVGGGTVRFEKNGGTFGSTGDNPRIFLTNVNGAAPGTVNLLGGWAYNTSDFQWVGYGANGIVNSTNTDQGAASFTPVAANIYNLNAGGTATLADAAGNVHSMAALRFGNNAAQTLAFADGANDTLFIGSGGILNDNSNQTRTIGAAAAAQKGKITAGVSGAAAGPKELFIHANQNVTTIFSNIVDNNGAVTLVKDLGGTLQLESANSYTGGTNLLGGRINVVVAGGLGSGPVLVKGSGLELRAPGATTAATGVITGKDGSEIYLQNLTGLYNTAGDRFVVEGGSGFTGNSNNAGQNLASITRIDVAAPFTAGGQVKLHPDAVIRTTNAFNGDVMTNMIGNLGANADLYFNQSGGGGQQQFINIGQGTPWKGLSSSVGNSGWTQGNIYAQSDIWLQGLTRVGANVVLTLGAQSAGTYGIINSAGRPINAFVTGQVSLNEDSPVSMPGDLTFVVTSGGYLQPTYTNSFGSQAGNLNSRVLIQAGGTVDPGNFVAVGLAANQPQGFAYPVPSPLNTNVVAEAGGRLLINDPSGIGSTTGGATFTMKANSILHLGNSQAFLGSNSGLVNPGQFVFEPGAIVRQESERNFAQNVFVNGEPNGKRTVLEIYGGDRNVTDAADPRIVAVPGTPTVVPMTFTYGNGGMITNDSNDRTIRERRGEFVLEDGAILAATSQTFFNIQENVIVPAGATVYVGSMNYVDGNPKNGLLQFVGSQSNVFGAGAKLVVTDGSAFGMNGFNTFPDTTPIELPAAVTNFAAPGAVGWNPGNGSSLVSNVASFAEIVGPVTGNGAVIANAAGAFLGLNVAANYSTNIVFKNANGQQANLWKIGSGTLTYTGTSDSTGNVWVGAGELKYTGTGASSFGENRLQKGGLLTLDNSGTALNNRLGGTARSVTPMGGTLQLIGNGTTAVQEGFSNLFNSAGNAGAFQGVPGYTTLKVVPGAAATTLLANVGEHFQSAGIVQQRSGTWLINSPTAGNAPMTYTVNGGIGGAIAPGAGATANGLVQIATPNFVTGLGTFGVQAGGVFGSAGSPVAGTRPDYLGDANGDGVADGFMTEDGVFYPVTNTSGTAVLTGLPTTSGLVAGMLIQGSVPAGTRILSVDSGSQVTLTNNTTAAAANMQFISGGMRNLATSEYSSSFRDNQNNGLNIKVNGTVSTSGDTRVSTLTLAAGSTLNIGGTLPLGASHSRLHLNSGGVFVQGGGTATINGTPYGNSRAFLQANGGASLFLHTVGDLNLNAAVFTDNAVVKTGAGTVNVGSRVFDVFRGSLQIDAGTVNLGTNNSFANIRSQNGSTSNNNLYLNGGTLNLGGNSVMINTLANNNELPGMGGTVTSATPATLMITGGGRFSGTVAGAISIDKNANNTLLLTNENTYTGSTVVRAGTLSLRDSGKLSATSSLSVANGTLQLDNSYLSNIVDRIAPATPVSLFGATVNITGAAGQVASQTFNNLTLAGGLNIFTSNAGGGGANEINIGNLIRPQGPSGGGAMLNFQQNYGFLGTAGNTTTAIRNFISNVNGLPVALNDGIIAGWAVVNGDHFATYNATTGVGYLSNTEDGYAGYHSGDATTATATQNVNDGTARTFTVSKTINSWRIGAAVTETLNDNVGLTLDTGGLITNVGGAVNFNPAANARNNSLTSNSGELDAWINQNTTSFNVPITGSIDLVKSGAGGLNLAASSLLTGTVAAGNATVTMANTNGLEVGDPITGGTASTFPAGTVIQSINSGVSITLSQPASVAGSDLRVTFGNSYTGRTIVNGGTLTLNQLAASPTARAVPGDLFINAATVTEANVGQQLNPSANITIGGGGRFNAVNLAGVTETFGSVTFLDGSSATGTANGLDRTTLQLGSTINLSSPAAITSANTNPTTGVPFIGGFAGNVGFTAPGGVGGGSTLAMNGPATVNGTLAVGLRFGARIGNVPAGVPEGGLIKSGPGLLTLDPDQNPTFAAAGNTAVGSAVVTGMSSTSGMFPGMFISGTNIPTGAYIISVDSGTQITMSANAAVAGAVGTLTGQSVNLFGSPTSPTEVLNIQNGVVRADRHGALGSPFAITTVQNGAVLLGTNTGSQTITGSITLKDGATLGATINSFTHGAATDSAANQTVLNIPSGTANIAAYDYFVPGSNNANITINGRLTGSGTISIVGPQITQGNGGGGVITLGNPLLSGAGAGQNNYSGTIKVGINSILANQVALIPKNTAVTRTTGNALGTATIELAGGRLRLRDDASANADVSNTTVTYGNNVTLSADSFMDANRQTSGSANGNIINLGTLTIPSGNRVLTVDSGNNYQVGFASISGAGTLVKAGGGRLNINAIGGGFSGGFGIAGPVGLMVAPTFNSTTAQNLALPASTTVSSFDVNGLYITEASKTLNVTGTFAVNANPGVIATNSSNNAGALAVTNTTTLTAATFANNGTVGAAGGAATITASTGFTGSGHYVTSGQNLTLAGNLTAGTPKIAGNGVVSATGTAHATSAEIQGGTLILAPTGAATSSGTIKVLGAPASAASATTAPIAAVSSTLNLDATAGAITHTGDITNNGLVRVSAGNATISGIISGTALGYQPGLLEGFTTAPGGALPVDNTRVPNPGNFGIRLEPRMLQTNAVTQQALTGHVDNDTWIYTGYVKDDDGVFSFAQNIDDRAAVWIDGTLVMNAANGGTSRVVSTAYSVGQAGTGAVTPGANSGTPSQNFGSGISLPGYGDGWHLIEIRMNNGSGGSGPITGNGFGPNYGFGYKNGIAALDGADMIKPIDDGTGNLFVTPVGGKGNITLDKSTVLNAGAAKLIDTIKFNDDGGVPTLNLTGTSGPAASSDTSKVSVEGAAGAPAGNFNLATGHVVTADVLNVNTGGTIHLNPASGNTGKLVLTGDGTGTGAVHIARGTMELAATGDLPTTPSITIDAPGELDVLALTPGFNVSNKLVNVNGTLDGDVFSTGGAVISGSGTITGEIDFSGSTTASILSPGNSPGILTTGTVTTNALTEVNIEIGGLVAGTDYDRISTLGGINLNGGTLVVSLINGFTPAEGDIFDIWINDGTDLVAGSGTFTGLPEGGIIPQPAGYFRTTYVANADAGPSANDIRLTYVPEPGAATLAMLAGVLALSRRRRPVR